MKFTILLPTRYLPERRKWLHEAIDSVKNQEHQDWELMLITDADIPVADYKIIKVPRYGAGVVKGLNTAMALSTGEIFFFLGDDDFILPKTLQIVNDEMQDCKWCYGNMLHYNQPYGSYDLWTLLNVGNSMPAITTYWSRAAYNIVGGWSEECCWAGDYEYWLRLGTRWEPKYINKILAYYRDHPTTDTRLYSGEVSAEAVKIRAKYKELK